MSATPKLCRRHRTRWPVAEGARASLFTIGLDRGFADALVEGVMVRHGGDSMALARGICILPNRRAVGAVRDAFVRRAGGAVLLPRLVSLGDGDLDEAVGSALDRVDDAAITAPVIDPMLRQLRMASLIGRLRGDAPTGELLRLAKSVLTAIDQLQIEAIPFAEFLALQDDEMMPRHWEAAFATLRAVLRQWPDEVAAIGCIDGTEARNQQLHATAQRWRHHGLPASFVIAAGISTSAPAVARLLRVIAFAPGGAVVLPHVDLSMDEEEWDALGDDPRKVALLGEGRAGQESHPQYHLKLLLERMGLARQEISPWPQQAPARATPNRVEFARRMTAAAQFTHDWPDLTAAQRRLNGVRFHALPNPAQEAMTIALLMREALETEGRTAALVTPDRAIAARVAAQLSRWDIVADDSAGTALHATPAGEFLLALAAVAASDFAPVELMALLTHPLTSRVDGRLAWLDMVRQLDLVLRGPRPPMGLDGLSRYIAASHRASDALKTWWVEVAGILAPMGDGAVDRSLAEWRSLLWSAVSALGGDAVWAQADGRALSQFMDAWSTHAAALTPAVTARDILSILRQLMESTTVRPPQGGHPRLFIWGLIEARLQRADLMILAGLNEGQWPPRPTVDPWLAPVIRRRLGLPGMSRQVGLSSHDFVCALGAEDVVVTRSRREGGAPTVASRLWLRMEALLEKAAFENAQRHPHPGWAERIDQAPSVPRMPRPRLAAAAQYRPDRLSVTEVDLLHADPFAFFARNALSLSRLDALDAEPNAALRGTMVHAVLDRWLKAGEWTEAAMEGAIADMLADPSINAIVRGLWAPRLHQAMMRFVGFILAGRADGREPIVDAAERRGSTIVNGIRLSGKPDRIDRLADGTLAIVDYKTGSSPMRRQVEAGYALQLGLLGMMAEQGAFTDQAERTTLFEYWRTNRKNGESGWVETPFMRGTKEKPANLTPDNFVAEAQAVLTTLIATYLTGDAPFVAKLAPEYAPYADYDQFMRLDEWITGDERDAGSVEPGTQDADSSGGVTA